MGCGKYLQAAAWRLGRHYLDGCSLESDQEPEYSGGGRPMFGDAEAGHRR
jgi:hypothetical protein